MASAQTAIEQVNSTRRSMREPSVASVGAQIAAEMPNAAISNPACSIVIASEAAMSLQQPADAQEAGRDEEVAGDENDAGGLGCGILIPRDILVIAHGAQ